MSTPIDKIKKAIWGSSVRTQGNRKEFFAQVDDLVGRFGLIDELMPTWRVLKHNDPNTPGEAKVKLAAANVVAVIVWFAEAPSVRTEIHVPIDAWKDEQGFVETQVLPKCLPVLVKALMHNAMAGAVRKQKKDKKAPPPPKLVLPP